MRPHDTGQPSVVSPRPVGELVREASARLTAGGTDSPRVEAELLAAHVLGHSRSEVAGLVAAETPSTPEQERRLAELVTRRLAEATPIQYLTGTASSGLLDLAVGPGVFIPRPETELIAHESTEWLSTTGEHGPIVVDLCSGSGTLALEIAHRVPGARVLAVELEPEALRWLERNARARAATGDAPVEVVAGDATDPALLADLAGRVDLVVANPPYIPDGAELPRDVAAHEPHGALFGGPDGLSVIRPLARVAAGLLRPGGALYVEHDDATGPQVVEAVSATGAFGTVEQRRDLAGRDRFVRAERTAHATRAAASRAEGNRG